MNDFFTVIEPFITDERLCVISLEGENVIGKIVKDEYGEYTGYMFVSVVCPEFIHRDNAISGQTTEDGGMSGYACEITAVSTDGDDLLIAFDEECSTYHRVHELFIFGRNCYAKSPVKKAGSN